MSTMRADNFGNRAGTSQITADTLLQGTAKSWANFVGSGVISVTDSFNVSSIVDIGVGTYDHNFSVSQPNTTYGLFGSCCTTPPGDFAHGPAFVRTVATFRFQTTFPSDVSGNATPADYGRVNSFCIGDPV